MSINLSFLSVLLAANKKARGVVFAAAVILLSGCASMTEKECLTASWLDKGFRDGRTGQALTRIEDHRQACAKVGVTPDDTQYFKGRDQGILYYCTPENAVIEGRKGRPYRNACPAHLEHQFLMSYEQGKQLYDAEQRIEDLERQSSRLEQSLREEDDKDKRRYLRQDLRELDRELRRARDDRRYLERRLRYSDNVSQGWR